MKQLALLVLLVFVAACSSETPESKPAPAAAPPPTMAASGPRVFFVEPADGATVKSPVHLKFGAENIMIMAVPPDPVTTVRQGMGHFHVGVDVDCLPEGTEIVKGTPTWVHLGKGDSEMDMQLTPGPHKLSLQIADDKHVALPGAGACKTINVTAGP
jgi:hypothetical protein